MSKSIIAASLCVLAATGARAQIIFRSFHYEAASRADCTPKKSVGFSCNGCEKGMEKAISKAVVAACAARQKAAPHEKQMEFASGYVIDVDLARVLPVIGERNVSSTCSKKGVVTYAYPKVGNDDGAAKGLLPVKLQTTQAWAAAHPQVVLALNANYFKFEKDSKVRENACGEVTGIIWSNGKMHWPLNCKDVKADPADAAHHTMALAFEASGTHAAMLDVSSCEAWGQAMRKAQVTDAVSGVPLLIGGRYFDNAGTNETALIARNAVGLFDPGQGGFKKLRVVVWENYAGKDKKVVSKGIRLPELAGFFRALGVDDAINMDGSGSASLVYKSGNTVVLNHTSDLEGTPRPVVSSFGFRLRR